MLIPIIVLLALIVIFIPSCFFYDEIEEVDRKAKKEKTREIPKQKFTVKYNRTYLYYQDKWDTEQREIDIECYHLNQVLEAFDYYVSRTYLPYVNEIEITKIYSYYPNSGYIYKVYDSELNLIEKIKRKKRRR